MSLGIKVTAIFKCALTIVTPYWLPQEVYCSCYYTVSILPLYIFDTCDCCVAVLCQEIVLLKKRRNFTKDQISFAKGGFMKRTSSYSACKCISLYETQTFADACLSKRTIKFFLVFL